MLVVSRNWKALCGNVRVIMFTNTPILMSSTLKTVKYSDFNQLPDHCLSLLKEVEKTNFFYGAGWFKNFSKNTISSDAQTVIYTVEDNSDTPNARAILFMRTSAGQTGSILENKYCGSKSISSMTAHQSLFYSPAIRADDQQYREIISQLAHSIIDDSWGVIDLNFMDPESREYSIFINAFKEHGLVSKKYFWRACIFENVKDITYADYLASRSKAVKKTYAYKQRKLEKTGTTRFELVSNSENIESAIADYEHVLSKSWKGAEPFPQHAAGLIREAASAGTLRLGLYYIDNKPVATHLWIVSAGRATICKHHHDAEFNKQSVGAILTLRMFEYALDVEKVHTIDFGVGDEPAKRYWLNDEEPLSGIVSFNCKTINGLLAFSLYTSREILSSIKNFAKPYLLPIKQRLTSPKSDKQPLAK